MTALLERQTLRVAGRPAVRLDAASKVTGRFLYGADIWLPGMLWGKIRRSEMAHGLVRRVDVSRALAVPGVRAVLTGEDVAGMKAGRLVRDEPILARDRVRYWGEPVAVVAADTPEIAEEAARRIEVDYEPLPVITDPEEALSPGAPLIHPDWLEDWTAPVVRRQGNIINHATVARGDVEEAFARAGHVFEDTYRIQHVHQTSLEGRVAVAQVDADGNIHVISSHQYPFGLRQDLADILGVPLGKIRVTASGVGGGFGGKLYASVEPYCVLLARKTGRPVKIALTREEELIATSPRMAAQIHVRTAVTRDGRLLARQGKILFDAGAYAGSSPGVAAVATMMLPGPYKWQALQIDSYAVYTNKANCGSYRAPGAPQAVFAGESQIDRIATALGMDPLDFRRRNAVEDGDLGPTGQVLGGVSLRETLDRAAAQIGWSEPRTRGEGPVRRGRGVACGWWTTTSGSSSAYIKLNEDGTVGLIIGATEIGTAALTAGVAQICAEEMGVDVTDVRIVSADTDATPYDFGAQGSRTTFQNGNAVIRAAADIKRQILELAGERLDCDPQQLELRDRKVRCVADPSRFLSLAESRMGQARGGLLGRGSYIAPPTEYDVSTVQGHTYPAFNSPSFYTHAVEVEVDTQTGEVSVVRYAVAQDVGFAVNPLYVKGQIAGGAVQGIGFALSEEVQYQGGRVLNPTLTDYKIPTAADVPDIEAVIVEVPSEEGPYGAKGVGEPPIVPGAAAIASAIYDAVGVRIQSLPITAEKVLRTLLERSDHPEGRTSR